MINPFRRYLARKERHCGTCSYYEGQSNQLVSRRYGLSPGEPSSDEFPRKTHGGCCCYNPPWQFHVQEQSYGSSPFVPETRPGCRRYKA